jgi:hypothetical protein
MCQRCVDAFEELWPELTEEQRMHFLWNCTAFPVGDNTRERLEHLLGRCGKDFVAVLALSAAEYEAEVRSIAREGQEEG